jgi:hypothetical protein
MIGAECDSRGHVSLSGTDLTYRFSRKKDEKIRRVKV